MPPLLQLEAPERPWRLRQGAPGDRWLARVRRVAMAALVGAALAACVGADENVYVEESVERLYNKGMDALASNRIAVAVAAFDEVERQHPYSPWATRAQLMAAYAHYQGNQYDLAINYAEHFIQLHPGHRDAAYARYLKAISYYEQISDVARDQKKTELALAALNEVVRRHPDTAYGRDAKLKIDFARDHLAGKEMDVGRFYLQRGAYIAAINRFRAVIENYQTTTHVPEALHRLTEAYLALGVVEEAQAAAAVLGHNYPGGRWYQDSYALLNGHALEPEASEGSWITRLWDSMF